MTPNSTATTLLDRVQGLFPEALLPIERRAHEKNGQQVKEDNYAA